MDEFDPFSIEALRNLGRVVEDDKLVLNMLKFKDISLLLDRFVDLIQQSEHCTRVLVFLKLYIDRNSGDINIFLKILSFLCEAFSFTENVNSLSNILIYLKDIIDNFLNKNTSMKEHVYNTLKQLFNILIIRKDKLILFLSINYDCEFMFSTFSYYFKDHIADFLKNLTMHNYTMALNILKLLRLFMHEEKYFILLLSVYDSFIREFAQVDLNINEEEALLDFFDSFKCENIIIFMKGLSNQFFDLPLKTILFFDKFSTPRSCCTFLSILSKCPSFFSEDDLRIILYKFLSNYSEERIYYVEQLCKVAFSITDVSEIFLRFLNDTDTIDDALLSLKLEVLKFCVKLSPVRELFLEYFILNKYFVEYESHHESVFELFLFTQIYLTDILSNEFIQFFVQTYLQKKANICNIISVHYGCIPIKISNLMIDAIISFYTNAQTGVILDENIDAFDISILYNLYSHEYKDEELIKALAFKVFENFEKNNIYVIICLIENLFRINPNDSLLINAINIFLSNNILYLTQPELDYIRVKYLTHFIYSIQCTIKISSSTDFIESYVNLMSEQIDMYKPIGIYSDVIHILAYRNPDLQAQMVIEFNNMEQEVITDEKKTDIVLSINTLFHDTGPIFIRNIVQHISAFISCEYTSYTRHEFSFFFYTLIRQIEDFTDYIDSICCFLDYYSIFLLDKEASGEYLETYFLVVSELIKSHNEKGIYYLSHIIANLENMNTCFLRICLSTLLDVYEDEYPIEKDDLNKLVTYIIMFVKKNSHLLSILFDPNDSVYINNIICLFNRIIESTEGEVLNASLDLVRYFTANEIYKNDNISGFVAGTCASLFLNLYRYFNEPFLLEYSVKNFPFDDDSETKRMITWFSKLEVNNETKELVSHILNYSASPLFRDLIKRFT